MKFDKYSPVYKAPHGAAPLYLSQLVRAADLPGRRCLRSARTNLLRMPSVKLSTVGGRAFPVAWPTISNSLFRPSVGIWKHLRSDTDMRYINSRFTYLLTYLLTFRHHFLTLPSILVKSFPHLQWILMWFYYFDHSKSLRLTDIKTAIKSFKVIQGHQSWYQPKSRMRLPISESYKPTSYLAPFLRYRELFVVNRFFMKLFKTTNMEIIQSCQYSFCFESPSIILQ